MRLQPEKIDPILISAKSWSWSWLFFPSWSRRRQCPIYKVQTRELIETSPKMHDFKKSNK